MYYGFMCDGLREMVWNTASAYIDGFETADEDTQRGLLEYVAMQLVDVCNDLNYNLDILNCTIEGIDDEDDLERALADIERELDSRF